VSVEDDVSTGANIGLGAAAAACAPIPGVNVFCAAGAAIARAFVAIGTAISKGARDTYHPDAAVTAAQLAVFETLPSALYAGYDTLTTEGMSNGANLVQPRTGNAAGYACRLVRYNLLISGVVPNKGNAPLYNPGDTGSKSNPYIESSTPDPAWPLTDQRVTQRILDQVNAAGGDVNSPTIRPLPKTQQEAQYLLAVLRSPHFSDSGILGWDPTQRVLPGLRRNAGRLMALAGETQPDPRLSAVLGGPVKPEPLGSVAAPSKDPKLSGAGGGSSPSPAAVAAGVTLAAGALAGLLYFTTRKRRR
jgi:hypothetical protein